MRDTLVTIIKREIPLVESDENQASTFGVLTRHIEDEHGMHPDTYEVMEEAMDKAMDEAMVISIM